MSGALDTPVSNLRQPSVPKHGFRHACEHCGGEITAMRGKMTVAMGSGCEMCGKDAAQCIAAQRPARTA